MVQKYLPAPWPDLTRKWGEVEFFHVKRRLFHCLQTKASSKCLLKVLLLKMCILFCFSLFKIWSFCVLRDSMLSEMWGYLPRSGLAWALLLESIVQVILGHLHWSKPKAACRLSSPMVLVVQLYYRFTGLEVPIAWLNIEVQSQYGVYLKKNTPFIFVGE